MTSFLSFFGYTLLFLSLLFTLVSSEHSQSPPKAHTTYLWHLQQPNYWPTGQPNQPSTLQWAQESIQDRSQQNGYPTDDLSSIFGNADRQADYQGRCAQAIQQLSNTAAGAQITYPGDLIQNINSLGQANNLGYSPQWKKSYTNALKWATPKGNRRLDIVNFPFHHNFGPLVPRKMYQMALSLNQYIFKSTWGTETVSKGLFPAEMAFSERMIPDLVNAGIEWVIVPNTHISRTVSNYSFSSPGDNTTPPNKADQVTKPQKHWFRERIDRGCTPNNAVPLSYIPHYAEYIDPSTGQSSKIIVVPSAMAMSWKDSESCYGINDIETIQPWNTGSSPLLVVLAHDGDNFYSGGYSYYTQCVSQFVSQAQNAGMNPTVIQDYLDTYPPSPNDIQHVEDGAWVNHDSDFGDPQFVFGWSSIPHSNGTWDVENGWDCTLRQWAIIVASQNWVDHATDASNSSLNLENILYPNEKSTNAELAWQFHVTQPSGYVYYGCVGDMKEKPAVAANSAFKYAKKAVDISIHSGFPDITPPTIWKLQRFPYNPGGYGAGAIWNWKLTPMKLDFHIFSFAYDVSGIDQSSSKIVFRTHSTPVSQQNKLYKSIKDSPWSTKPLSFKAFSKIDPAGKLKFAFPPDNIADIVYVAMNTDHSLKNLYMDYYFHVVDQAGNVVKSDMYHVFIE